MDRRMLLFVCLSLPTVLALFAGWARWRSNRTWRWLAGSFERTPETEGTDPPPNWLLTLTGVALAAIALIVWLQAPTRVSWTCEVTATVHGRGLHTTLERADHDRCPDGPAPQVARLTIRSVTHRDDDRPDAFAAALMAFALTLAFGGLFYHRIEKISFGPGSVGLAKKALPREVEAQADRQGVPSDVVPWAVQLADASLPEVRRATGTSDYRFLAREAATKGVSDTKSLIDELERLGPDLTDDQLSTARAAALEELVRIRIADPALPLEEQIARAAKAGIAATRAASRQPDNRSP